jgi:NAD(P)-dependent dehydrogenase (short-subunit alcohol dehydrogenase family)
MQAFALQAARSPRLGEPGDLAAVVAFLFSDDAEWISGQVWSICGGISLRD